MRFFIFVYGKTLFDKFKLVFFPVLFTIYYVSYFYRKDVSEMIMNLKLDCRVNFCKHELYLPTFDSIMHFSQLFYREKEVLEAINEDKRKNVFLDVGAHIGTLSVCWINQYKKGVLIEANPFTLDILKENLQGSANVLILNKLAYSNKTEKFLYINFLNSGATSIKRRSKVKIKVETDTLDNMIKENKIKPDDISFMKIDVEGAELDVLKGATNILKKGKPVIVFEALTSNAFNRVSNFLKNKGYTVVQLNETNYLAKI